MSLIDNVMTALSSESGKVLTKAVGNFIETNGKSFGMANESARLLGTSVSFIASLDLPSISLEIEEALVKRNEAKASKDSNNLKHPQETEEIRMGEELSGSTLISGLGRSA